MSMRSAQKQAALHETQEEEEQVEKRDVVGTTEEEFKEKEEEEKAQIEAENESIKWPFDQRGFCCDEGFSCVTLTIDSGWVVCWSEK